MRSHFADEKTGTEGQVMGPKSHSKWYSQCLYIGSMALESLFSSDKTLVEDDRKLSFVWRVPRAGKTFAVPG